MKQHFPAMIGTEKKDGAALLITSTYPYNQATVTLSDYRGSPSKLVFTEFKIIAHEAAQLKKSTLFQSAKLSDEKETYWNTWETRTFENGFIKFSENCAYAFVFEGQIDLTILDCQELISTISMLEFFQERLIAEKCQSLFGKTLHEIEGMTEATYQAMAKKRHQFNELSQTTEVAVLQELIKLPSALLEALLDGNEIIKMLLENNIPVPEFAAIDPKRITKLHAARHNLAQCLKLATPRQLLGLQDEVMTYPAADKISIDFSRMNRKGTVVDSCGSDYLFVRFQVDTDRIILISESSDSQSKTQFLLRSTWVEESDKAEHLQKFQQYPVTHLLHTWHINTEMHSRYCADLGYYCDEVIDKAFPLSAVIRHTAFLSDVLANEQYYREVAFQTLLKKHGTSLEALRALPGMTQEKLVLLFSYSPEMLKLKNKGMGWRDFAVVDYDRLAYVMQHLKNANGILELISVESLLSFKKQPEPGVIDKLTQFFSDTLGFFAGAKQPQPAAAQQFATAKP